MEGRFEALEGEVSAIEQMLTQAEQLADNAGNEAAEFLRVLVGM
ncbi:MAG: hypothetical protein AAB955_03580 [Patescibacteria group bacterium]